MNHRFSRSMHKRHGASLARVSLRAVFGRTPARRSTLSTRFAGDDLQRRAAWARSPAKTASRKGPSAAARRLLAWVVVGFVFAATLAPVVAGEAPSTRPAERYGNRDPHTLTVARRPVKRKDYVDFVRSAAQGFEAGPDRGQYGPRHALPALAVFALEPDRKLGEGIKKTLKHYADWVHAAIAKDGGVFSMEGATLCALHFRELRKHGLMSAEDERWAKELFLALGEHHFAWRPRDGLWRGSHHRSQAQGINHALAARFYPDEPNAAAWKAYADRVWSDWWDFRDVGINDTGYFYSSFGNILRAAEILGRKEVFTDPQARMLFDRILEEITPDGAGVPYGASGGYNSAAGTRILALELAAKYTRDGRYRWGAERLMNFGQARGFSNNHHHLQAVAWEDIALASVLCDDSIAPVPPEGSSKLLMRKEIIRLTDEEARQMFPEAGGVDCNMYMTHKEMPHKLVFRSGWNPGDLYMLVECYPRHDPLNPTAILALERHSAAFAEMASEKFVSRENAVHIHDLDGRATYLGQKNFRGAKQLPVGWAGMETTVPAFSDHALASHARVQVGGYMGYAAEHEREFLFVKNGFVLVRDETTFADTFRARIGPNWNTQNVGRPRGEHWVNTWFTGHYFQTAQLYTTPPWDLLIYHAPRADCRLAFAPVNENPQGPSRLTAVQYAWEGEVKPGMRLQFVQVLLPHAPLQDATPLAATIRVLANEPGWTAVCLAEGPRRKIAFLNPSGANRKFQADTAGSFSTDARAGYLETNPAGLDKFLVIAGTHLAASGEPVVQGELRQTWERLGSP